MRQAVLLLCTALVTAPLASEVAGEALDFTATALDGTAVSGASLAGRFVLLDFWGTWCAPCVEALPRLEGLQRRHADRLAVVGLAFYSGTGEEVAAFLGDEGITAYTAWLGEDANLAKFGILAFPSYVLIDPEGSLVFEQIGELPDVVERVEEAIELATGARSAPS